MDILTVYWDITDDLIASAGKGLLQLKRILVIYQILNRLMKRREQ